MEVAMFDPLLQIYDAAVDPIEELMWITGGWILYGPVLLLVVALVVLSIILIRRSTRKNKAQAFAEVPTQAYPPPPVAGAEQAYPPQAGAPQAYPPPQAAGAPQGYPPPPVAGAEQAYPPQAGAPQGYPPPPPPADQPNLPQS